MTINGLPAHALIVHAAVVFGTLAPLGALAYVLVPRWREWLRWPMVAVAVAAGLAIVAAFLSGNNYLDSKPVLRQLSAVRTHESRADKLLWVMIAFSIVAAAVGYRHEKSGTIRIAGDAVLGVLAVAVLVLVVLTGDAGAHAVWGS